MTKWEELRAAIIARCFVADPAEAVDALIAAVREDEREKAGLVSAFPLYSIQPVQEHPTTRVFVSNNTATIPGKESEKEAHV